MPDIKTRDTVKGTIKTLDKAAVAGERMKEAYVRTKEKAEHGVYSAESSPEEYAADRFSGGTETVTYLPMLALPIFPGRLQPSIVGRSELNFRVRDGNGWTLALISTNCCIATASLQ